MITYYRLYAERHSDYGQTFFGNFLKRTNAEKKMKELMKKYIGKGHESNDGYFLTDWNITESQMRFEDE